MILVPSWCFEYCTCRCFTALLGWVSTGVFDWPCVLTAFAATSSNRKPTLCTTKLKSLQHRSCFNSTNRRRSCFPFHPLDGNKPPIAGKPEKQLLLIVPSLNDLSSSLPLSNKVLQTSQRERHAKMGKKVKVTRKPRFQQQKQG